MRFIHLLPLCGALSVVPACGGSESGAFSPGPGGTGGSSGSSSSAGGSSNTNGGSSGSGGSTTSETGLPIEDLPAQYAAALCEAYLSCAGALYEIFLPDEDCVKNVTTQLEEELATLPHAVATGRVEYHGDKAQACLDEVAARSCEELSQRNSEACLAALSGTVAEDAACDSNEECQPNLYCKLDGACPGACTPLEAAGRACTSDSHCRSGLKCGATGLCVAPAQAGEACKQGEPDCADGYLCLGDSASENRPGECIAIEEALSGKLGDECTFTQLCEPGLSCEVSSLTPFTASCVEKVASGAACRPALPDECPTDEFCQIGINPFAGECTTRPAPGEPCGKGIGEVANVCEAYARCDGGTCRALANAGEGCTDNATCYSGRCIEGACVAGSACD